MCKYAQDAVNTLNMVNKVYKADNVYEILISSAYTKLGRYLRKYSDGNSFKSISQGECYVYLGEQMFADCYSQSTCIAGIKGLLTKGYEDYGFLKWGNDLVACYFNPVLKYLNKLFEGINKKHPNVIIENVMVVGSNDDFIGVCPAVTPYYHDYYECIRSKMSEEQYLKAYIDSFNEKDGLHIGLILGIDLNN